MSANLELKVSPPPHPHLDFLIVDTREDACRSNGVQSRRFGTDGQTKCTNAGGAHAAGVRVALYERPAFARSRVRDASRQFRASEHAGDINDKYGVASPA